jgi:Ca2+-binding RTX toxin-like protein
MAISTNGLQLVRLAGAVFNQRLSASDYSEILASNKTAAELDAWANAAVASEFRNKTTTDIAKAVLANVGLSSVAGLEAWVAGQLTAGGGVAKAGASLLAMLNDYSNMSTTEAIYGASVVTFNNKVANSQSQSQTAGTATGTYEAVSALAPSVASATLTLTTGSDSLVGGAGSDTFSAAVSATGLQTLTGGDKLYGGEGTDTLSTILNAGYTVTPGVLSSIENLEVTSVTTASGIDLANATGLSSVTIAGSSVGTTVSNVPSLAVATNLTGNTGSATVSFLAAAVAGTADSYTVNIANQTGAISFSGIENLTIKAAAGSTNSGLNASATKVAVTGGDVNTTVDIGTTTSASVTAAEFAGNTFTVTSSASAANITGANGNDSVTLTNATGSAAHVVSTGTGDDSIQVGGIATDASTRVQTYTNTTGATSISAGAGNDSITFAGGYEATDTIDGGDGIDTLVLKVAGDFGISAAQTKMTGIEKVTYSEASATTAKIGGITLKNFGTSVDTLTLSDTTASVSATLGKGTGEDLYDSGTFAFNAGASTFNITGILNSNITVSADGTGTTDSLAMNLTNYSSGVGVTATQTSTPSVTATGIESLTINSGTRTNATTYNTFGAISPTSTGGTDATVKFTGFSAEVGAVNAKIIDASGMTSQGSAEAGLVMTAASTSVTGQTITGSGTQDTLYGGGGNDVINGGAGNDSMLAGSGTDNLNGGAGNDTIDFASAGNFTTSDSVDGGEGTDKLRLTDSDAVTISTGTTSISNISNIETLSLSDAAVNSVNITRFGGLSNLEFANATAAINGSPTYSNLVGPVTLTYVGPATTVATNTVTASLKTDSGSDTLAVSLVPSAANASNDFGNVSAGNFETVAITASRSSTNTTTTAALLDLTNTSGTTSVTVSGSTTLATIISSTALATFDASANTAGVNATMTASAVALTATGTSAADTIASGAGSDNISGGDGNDSIIAGAGSDTVNGGGGDDTLDGGAGADSISGGGGTDSLVTSAGADTLDGGDGTDTLTISSAAYTNLTGLTLSGIETLNANNNAFTSTVSQFQGITTFTNASTVTFIDAGTITGKSGVTKHTLANGTNTVTAFGTSATDQSILGGTGADTINISSTYLTVADTITGGSGVDTVNVTGNTATTATTNIDKISGVETITFANTTTNVDIAPHTDVAADHIVTIDTTAMTTGTLKFVGSNETTANAAFIVSAGSANDSITGSDGADSIYGGYGDDLIVGGKGADALFGDQGSDTFKFVATNGSDSILDFVLGAGGDVLNLGALTATAAGASDILFGGTTMTPISATATGRDVNDKVAFFKGDGSTSTKVADLFATAANGTGKYFWLGSASDGTENGVIIAGADNSSTLYVWHIVNLGTAGVASGEVTLVGTITVASGGDIDNFALGNFTFIA